MFKKNCLLEIMKLNSAFFIAFNKTRVQMLSQCQKYIYIILSAGAADRVIKIWDLASGKLKVSLTGHVSTVRGITHHLAY